MERHGKKPGQSNNEKDRLTASVARLFLRDDIDRFVDADLYEEDFYSQPEDAASFFYRRKPQKEQAAMFQDPVFFSIRDFDSRENKRERENMSAPDSEQMIDGILRDFQHMRNRKKKNRFSGADKKTIGAAISLILTFVLMMGLVAAFFLAYQYSDSKTYRIKRDKIPPAATVSDHTIFSYETLKTEDLVSDIQDETAVTVVQLDPIDYSADGEQAIRIELTDEAENQTILTARVTVVRDTTAPTIVCEPLVRVTTGQSVAYKSFVVVHDDYDGEPEITVDNSQVDLSREGRYPLSYTATDKSGNSATKSCEIEVSPASGYVADEDVWALVDAMLSYIVDDSMDDIHKVWAVYEYVRNIPYSLTEYSYDYMYEGYKILHDNKGDCYGSYAASKLMLDRLGIDNIPIETSSNGRHFWNMVSLDAGKTWYHFDATQWTQWYERPIMCMISSDELYRISEEHLGTHRYDTAAYPQTPSESMPVPDDIVEIYGYDY